MVSRQNIYSAQIGYHLMILDTHVNDFNFLENEFGHILNVLDWLSKQQNIEMNHNLLIMIEALCPYMEARSLSNITVKYIEPCLKAAEVNHINPVNIYLMAYRAQWALGQWDEAKSFIDQAVESDKTAQPSFYADTLRCLGSLQINRGEYQAALSTLTKSRQLYHDLGDRQGEISTIAEEAAYYLDKDDYTTADRFYSEVAEFEKSTLGEPSTHTLLMLGVVYRRLDKLAEALECFERILQRADPARAKSDRATASHHIAWILIDLSKFKEAQNKASEAKIIYDTIQDARGSSDADEQLGEIEFYLHQYKSCEGYYLSCAKSRIRLKNKPGYASITRRLSNLYFTEKKYFHAAWYFTVSALTYLNIGNLTMIRIKRFFRNTLSQNDSLKDIPIN